MFLCKQSISQELTFFPGAFGYQYYEDHNQLKKSEFESILKTDPISAEIWKKHKVINVMAVTSSLTGVFLTVYSLNFFQQPQIQLIYIFGGLAATGVSAGLSIYANNLRKDAILTYNYNLDVGSLYLGPTRNGVGLVYNF